MIKILFVAEAVTLAHHVRVLKLAKIASECGYEIAFASSRSVDLTELSENACFRKISSISTIQFAESVRKGKILFPEQTLTDYVRDDLNLIQEVRPNFIVGDFRLSLGVSSKVSGIPYAAVTNSYWSPYADRRHLPVPDYDIVRLIGLGCAKPVFRLLEPLVLRMHAAPLNRVYKKFGISPPPTFFHGFTDGDYILYADSPCLSPMRQLPENNLFIGPVIWSPDTSIPTSIRSLLRSHKTAYISLGSSGDYSRMSEIVTGVVRAGYGAIVSTAGNACRLPKSRNVAGANFLPGCEMAKQADFVICNGGSPTAYQALCQGKPVIGVAHNMDQYLNMERVQEKGLGILLRSGDVTAKSVAASIAKVIPGSPCSDQAQILLDKITAIKPEREFVRFLAQRLGVPTLSEIAI